MKKRSKIVISPKVLNISSCISDLLCEHDCVIVPGFGGFVARPLPARFAKPANILLPPGRSLVFNKNLTNNDGLLAGFIMQKNSVAFKDAVSAIEMWVSNALRKLREAKRFELERTGLLFYDTENNLLFEPFVQNSREIHSFGLSPVTAIKISQGEKEIAGKKEFTDRQLQPSAASKRILRASLVSAAVLLFAFLVFLTAKQPAVQNALASLNPFAKKGSDYITHSYGLKNILNAPVSKNKFNAGSGFKLNPNSSRTFFVAPDTIHADKTAVTKLHTRPGAVSFSGNYQIVVGCFAIQQNAFKLIGQLKTQNVDANIVGQNARGLYIVSVGGFSDQALAQVKLTDFKMKFPNAWLLVR